MAPITIHRRTWDPEGSVDVPDSNDPAHTLYPKRAADATDTDFIIIQTKESLSDTQYNWLLDHKVHIQSRVDAETFLCKYKPPELDELRNQDFIRYADVYHTYWKFPPALHLSKLVFREGGSKIDDENEPADSKAQTLHIIIEPHISANPNSPSGDKTIAQPETSVQKIFEKIIEEGLVDQEHMQIFSNRIEAVVDVSNIQAIARIDLVRAIGQANEEHPYIAIARDLLNCPSHVPKLTHSGANTARHPPSLP
ncbi:hypothetical protein H072_11093 [Dactylellina haptotyla CBS 200.50]|uniref:Uncharacterized protein n=1 Tax=Dactylellina haptotyla (strain CBS 200.50) TaxID=1284197 RepID=S8A318_DACHA|nr:hypothetical protein H072_11093 [Dactylellina haptotyla CBS 200.50]